MPDFAYRGLDAAGRLCQGTLRAPNAAAALRQLRAQGVAPLDLGPASAAPSFPPISDRPVGVAAGAGEPRRRVRPGDLATWTSELATMLRAGLPLDRGLRLLEGMAPAGRLRAVSRTLLEDIKAGQPFSRALARHPGLFDEFYVNLVRAGEATGHLAEALERIREHQERVRELRDRAVAAATYPAILAVVSVVSLLIMLLFVVPQFRSVFGELGDRLPLATQIVMGLSDVLTRRPWLSGGIGLAAVAALLVAAGHPAVRRALLNTMYRWPFIGPLMLRYRQAVFARTLGALLNHGVGLVAALSIAGDAFDLPGQRQGVAELAVQVKGGRRLGEALQTQGFFEPLVVNLVKVGEETGRLGPMWSEAATIIEREVQQRLQRLLALLEPALILVLGALIAGIILSILMGILAVNDLASI